MDGELPPSHPDLEQEPEKREVPRFAREKFYTDSGRTVYGGGGITPDIEIEQDYLTDFEIAVERDGALFSWAVEYANAHQGAPLDWRPGPAEMQEFKAFLTGRENIEEYLADFDLTLSDSLVDANSAFLERGLRRELSRRLHGSQAAYRVAIEADTQLHEALELFRQTKTLPELLELARKWNEEQIRQLAAEDAEAGAKTTAN